MIPLDIRKELIDKGKGSMSICQQCEMLSIARSTLYYTPSMAKDKDLELMKELDRLYLEDPTRGTRRMSKELKKKGFQVGRYHVRTLMQTMRMKTIFCRPRTTVIDPAKYKYPYLLRNLEITRPNQVWSLDITYIPMQRGFMYLVAIMDVYSRYILGWSLSNTMEAQWVVDLVRTTVLRHGKPEIINSDQGSQFTSDEYVSYVKSLETVRISMDGKGRALTTCTLKGFGAPLNTTSSICLSSKPDTMFGRPVMNLSDTITTKEDIHLWMTKHLNMFINQLHNPFSRSLPAKLFPKFLVELLVGAPQNFRITLLVELFMKKNIINLKNVVQLS